MAAIVSCTRRTCSVRGGSWLVVGSDITTEAVVLPGKEVTKRKIVMMKKWTFFSC